VTTEIAASVARLQKIGVQKVLVNNLYPVGCAPSQSRPSNYTRCDEQGNQAASLHNKYLAGKLADREGVLVLDLSATFTEIVGHHADGTGEVAKNFRHKLKPCCVSADPSGYCGLRQYDENHDVVLMYTVCGEPNKYFYWDDMNPTQAGWAAVMGQLESPIKEFLGLD
jgi:phospholipase/lecithinase/hemolysin